MTRRTRPRRSGFTLVELLTVVGIMAMLAALTAAAVGRIRAVQQAKATDSTVSKLQIALDQQWKAVLDQCKQDNLTKGNREFEKLVPWCDHDRDRAEALWAYMNLKREFPQTFAEAKAPIVVGPASLAPRATYAAVGGPVANEAAVLLYLNLSEKGNRGMVFNVDDATAGAQTMLGSFTAFKDAYGSPITFARFTQNTELNGVPYVNPNQTIHDPIDPRGKLQSWSSPKKQTAQSALGVKFDGENKRIVVFSAGQNKMFESNSLTSDDVFGYRLLRQGNRGD